MDSSLATFLEKGLEFVVGGAIFLASTFFLLFAIEWQPAISIAGQAKLLPNGLVVTLFLVAAYAAGVIVESLCRFLFEWDLKRITVRRPEFLGPQMVSTVAAPGSFTEVVLGRVKRPAEQDAEASGEPAAEGKVTAPLTALLTLVGRSLGDMFRRRSGRALWARSAYSLGGYYSLRSCEEAEGERERQRLAVAMSDHDGLKLDIESQLKRLRLERIAALSLALVFAGFVVQGATIPALATLGLLAVMIRIVHGRFRRFCRAIARGYLLAKAQGKA